MSQTPPPSKPDPEESAEENDDDPETEESETESDPKITTESLAAEVAELKKMIAALKPAEESTEEPKDGADKTPKKDLPDPLAIDFAETLKSQLGKAYSKEFDKLPLNVRIPAMKAVLGVQKKPAVREGKIPKGQPANTVPVRANGSNFMLLAKKIREE